LYNKYRFEIGITGDFHSIFRAAFSINRDLNYSH